MVVGDLHGNISAFKQVLAIAALDRHPGRHLVLQELIHGPLCTRTTRAIARTSSWTSFAALKCQYPERVHLILGNHELSELTGPVDRQGRRGTQRQVSPRASTRPTARSPARSTSRTRPCSRRCPWRSGRRIASTSATRSPTQRDLDALDLDLLKADSWPEDAMKRRGTIYALTWGRDTTPETADRFAAMVDADFFVTGHQPCDEGFRQANHRQIIIDGTNPYPCYCLFPADRAGDHRIALAMRARDRRAGS